MRTPEPSSQYVEWSSRAGICTLRLNRPDKLNALNRQVFVELRDALRRIGDDESVGVVVLAGAGRAFCTGLDLQTGLGEPGEGWVETAYELMSVAVECVALLREIPQPIIASVQSHAVGAGFALAVAADFRVVSNDAVFNPVFTRIGMSSGDLGLSYFLPRIIGAAAAAEIFYRARPVDADEALRIGLAHQCVTDPAEAAEQLAAELSERGRFALAQTKSMLNHSFGDYREHMALEMRTQIICSATAQHQLARQSFKGSGRKRGQPHASDPDAPPE